MLASQDIASVRRSRGISLDEISERTKIRVSLLRAIEEGRFDELPGGIYSISFIRQYEDAVGTEVPGAPRQVPDPKLQDIDPELPDHKL